MRKRVIQRIVIATAAVGVLGTAGPTGAGTGEPLTSETFQDAAVADPGEWLSGGSPGACLTAGTDTTQLPIPGCDLPVPDAPGSGALRLTPNDTGSQGFVISTNAFPTTGGLDITFHQAQYGGDFAGDGISFFLVDGTASPTAPGSGGAGLGYANDTIEGTDGIVGALLGIGLDWFGNFTAADRPGGFDCTEPAGSPGSKGLVNPVPNDVTIRGGGNGSSGYCWLGHSDALPVGLELHGTTRTNSDRLVRIVVDPASVANPNATVFLDGTQVLQIPAPAALLAAPTFKFGFAASTGGATDAHEVWGLAVDSVVPVTPTPEAPPAPPPTGAAPVAPTVAFTG